MVRCRSYSIHLTQKIDHRNFSSVEMFTILSRRFAYIGGARDGGQLAAAALLSLFGLLQA